MLSVVLNLASRVKLATLSTGRPRFNRLHKPETKALAQKHNVDAGRVTVKQCDDARLEAIDKVFAEARDLHNTLTRPTIDGLCRLLPCGLEFKHAAAMSDLKHKALMLSQEFLDDYERLAAEAPVRLNGLYDANVWKTKAVIAEKFVFVCRYLPCPTDGEWGAWLEDSVAAAQHELVGQLTDAIKRVAERCASDGPLYHTVFTNLDDLLKLVPDLDLKKDPKIRELLNQAKGLVCNKNELKAWPSKRAEVAAQAKQMLSAFGEGRIS
jgi:hypothetical protein